MQHQQPMQQPPQSPMQEPMEDTLALIHEPEQFPELEQHLEQQGSVDKSKDWMKYSTGFSRRDAKALAEGGKKKSKLGRNNKNNEPERPDVRNVKQMPFTDQFGDFGFYTGQVDGDGKPDGKGNMKYENGVFYEGTWTIGAQDKAAASQYERIRGGFTSWSGKGKSGTKSGMILPWNARKNDGHNALEKTNTRGMEWTDLNGDSGRYTGEVNDDQLPHGRGIMRYDFGLIAEGEWNNGVLKEGPQDRMIGVAAAMNGGQSVAPPGSGMSIGPGASGFTSAAISVLGGGGISVAPSTFGGGGSMGMGMNPMAMNPMMAMANQSRQASQHAMIAQQNALLKNMYGGAGSVYGGAAGSVYGCATGSVMPMQMQQMMPMQPMQ